MLHVQGSWANEPRSRSRTLINPLSQCGMRGQTRGVPWLLLLLLITAVLVCTADDLLVLLESDAAVLHHLLHAWAPLEHEIEILLRTATHCNTLQQRLLACGRASRVQYSPAHTPPAPSSTPPLPPLSFSSARTLPWSVGGGCLRPDSLLLLRCNFSRLCKLPMESGISPHRLCVCVCVSVCVCGCV